MRSDIRQTARAWRSSGTSDADRSCSGPGQERHARLWPRAFSAVVELGLRAPANGRLLGSHPDPNDSWRFADSSPAGTGACARHVC
jgi:hypothetical protein